jgi:hypothetical protein
MKIQNIHPFLTNNAKPQLGIIRWRQVCWQDTLAMRQIQEKYGIVIFVSR